MARWLSWLERRPVTAEVDGSNPFRVVIGKNHFLGGGFLCEYFRIILKIALLYFVLLLYFVI